VNIPVGLSETLKSKNVKGFGDHNGAE